MKKLLLISWLCCLTAEVVAQAVSTNTYLSESSLKGHVTDLETGNLLTDATIALKDRTHKIISIIPWVGEGFSLRLDRSKEHLLHLYLTGYLDSVIIIPKNSLYFIDLGNIGLRKAGQQLQAVVVTPPLVVQLPGKTLYHVSEDPGSKSALSFDLFRKVPGITIDGRDQIRLNGQTNFRILINGRPSNLFTRRPAEVLKQFPASLIKDIEILSPPPARYEAEGVGGVINLVLLRSKVKGTTGSLSLSHYSPSQFGQTISYNGRYGKWGISSLFTNSLGRNPVMPGSSSLEDLENKLTIDQTGSGGSQSHSQMGNLELSYEANPYNQFNAAIDLNKGGGSNAYQQQVTLSNLAYASDYSEYRSEGTNTWNGLDISLDYQHSSPVKANRTLTAALRQSQSLDGGKDYYEEYQLDYSARTSSRSNNNSHYLERTAQIDYFTPFQKHSFELGSKYINRKNYSLAYYGFSKNYTVVDDLQEIGAWYSSLSLQWGTWRLRLGTRAETSRVKVFFRSDSTSVDRSYWNVLPNVSLNKTIKKYSSLFLNYSQRIQRPGIHYLNPFVEVIDPYTISYGNPQLFPALFHAFNLGYHRSFRQSSFNTNLNYQFSNNSIVEMNEWQQDTLKGSTYGNLGTYRYAGFSINHYLRLSEVVTLSLGGNVNYYAYGGGSRETTSANQGFSETINAGLSLSFKKSWTMSGQYNYNGTQLQYQSKIKGYSFHSFTLNKNFSKKRLSGSVSLQNPFQKNRKNEYQLATPSFLQKSSYTVIMRRYTVTLNWSFGKFSAGSTTKSGRAIQNEDLMK